MLAGPAWTGATGCAEGPVCAGGKTGAVEGEAAFAPAGFPASPAAGLAAATTTFTFPNLNPASCKLRLALPSG